MMFDTADRLCAVDDKNGLIPIFCALTGAFIGWEKARGDCFAYMYNEMGIRTQTAFDGRIVEIRSCWEKSLTGEMKENNDLYRLYQRDHLSSVPEEDRKKVDFIRKSLHITNNLFNRICIELKCCFPLDPIAEMKEKADNLAKENAKEAKKNKIIDGILATASIPLVSAPSTSTALVSAVVDLSADDADAEDALVSAGGGSDGKKRLMPISEEECAVDGETVEENIKRIKTLFDRAEQYFIAEMNKEIFAKILRLKERQVKANGEFDITELTTRLVYKSSPNKFADTPQQTPEESRNCSGESKFNQFAPPPAFDFDKFNADMLKNKKLMSISSSSSCGLKDYESGKQSSSSVVDTVSAKNKVDDECDVNNLIASAYTSHDQPVYLTWDARMELVWAQTAVQVELACKLCYDVYVAEMNYYRSVADHTARSLRDDFDEGAEVLLAYKSGLLIGTLRLHRHSHSPIPEAWYEDMGIDLAFRTVSASKVAVITRFVLLANYRGNIHATTMMIEVFRRGFNNGVELALMDCVPHLIGKYRRMGFRRFKQCVFDKDVGLLVPMAIAVCDYHHLLKCSSPFASIVTGMERPSWCDDFFALDRDDDVLSRIKNTLGGVLFSGGLLISLTESEVGMVLCDAEIFDARFGSIILRENTISRSPFIILDGSVDIIKGGITIAKLHMGDCLGEMNFLLKNFRSSDVVVSSERATLIILSERRLALIEASRPDIALKLHNNLSQILAVRLAQTSSQYVKTAPHTVNSKVQVGVPSRSVGVLQPGDVLSYSAGSGQTGADGYRVLTESTGAFEFVLSQWPHLARALGQHPPLVISAYPAALGLMPRAIVVDTYLSERTTRRAVLLAQREGMTPLLVAQPLIALHHLLALERAGIRLEGTLMIAVGGYPCPRSLHDVLHVMGERVARRAGIVHLFGAAEVDAGCLAATEWTENCLTFVARPDVMVEPATDGLWLSRRSARGEMLRVKTLDFAEALALPGTWKITACPARYSPTVLAVLERWGLEDWRRRTGFVRWDRGALVAMLREGVEVATQGELEHWDYARRFGFSWLSKPNWSALIGECIM